MDFINFDYYTLFLPIVVLLVMASRRKLRRQISILLISSYIFFILASGWHVILLIISTVIDWFAGSKIHNSDKHKTRKKWLLTSLFVNLGLLCLFKYIDFIIKSLNLFTMKIGHDLDLGTLNLILPVGISFYTFQTMSYTIDIYRRKHTPYENFIDFASYAAFFPQLVAGPIVRSQHFLEQIRKPLASNAFRTRLGLTLIIYGLAKKIVIADNVALHVDSIFSEGTALNNTALVWWGALCFGIQIYCDFSAYTDIALGSAHLLGIELPENFNSPYSARSPQDFWRRWHISLSTWLRDYLYIPLGGSRGGTKVLVFSIMGTMILGGLWHGASWNFVLWGVIHGLLLLFHRALLKLKILKTLFSYFPKGMSLFGWVTTQFFVFMTWLIFRVEDTSILVRALKSYLFIDSNWDIDEFLQSLPDVKLLVFSIVLLFIVFHGISWKVGGLKIWISKQNPIIWSLVCGSLICAAILLKPAENVEFIYFRF
ncbi:MAG: MBOAT family protein [Euryarchaeota archaeon]|nr:MBOAT family protein [Euryarchaeota archaeon]